MMGNKAEEKRQRVTRSYLTNRETGTKKKTFSPAASAYVLDFNSDLFCPLIAMIIACEKNPVT